MKNVLENTNDAAALPQGPRLLSRIFGDYRNHFGLFWRVMLPVMIVSLILNVTGLLFFKLAVPEVQWTFSTSKGIGARSSSTLDRSSGTLQPFLEPPGVNSGVGFSGSSFHIGLLWLAICPLAFIIVHHRRGVEITFSEVWQHTLRKTWSILSGCVLLIALVLGINLIVFPLVLLIDLTSIGGVPASIFLFVLIPGVPIAYFTVKWSLYNQGIIIENLSTMAAFRRSSELVRGAWGPFFGMYLLLTLVTMVFTTVVLGLTLLMFSVVSPEFVPLREVLQSGKFFSLFFGGYVKITLESAPIWAIAVVVAVTTLVHAVLAPIWALLTTHLYIERAETRQGT